MPSPDDLFNELFGIDPPKQLTGAERRPLAEIAEDSTLGSNARAIARVLADVIAEMSVGEGLHNAIESLVDTITEMEEVVNGKVEVTQGGETAHAHLVALPGPDGFIAGLIVGRRLFGGESR